MGNSTSELTEERLQKFNEADSEGDYIIRREAFEQIYVNKNNQRPSWQDWKKFMECDTTRDFKISNKEFKEYFN